MKTRLGLMSSKHARLGLLVGCLSLSVLFPQVTLADSVPQQPSNQNAAPLQTAVSAPQQVAPPSEDSQSEDEGQEAQLPPGHPPIDSAGTGAGLESAMGMQGPANGGVIPSSAVPAGTVEVHVVNDEKQPASGITVILNVHRESVAEGNTDEQRDAVTDASGIVRFDHLSSDTSVSYRLQLSYGGARYGIQPFQLNAQQGVVATMRQYALVRDIKKALVATESMVFVEPKDNVFQFDVVYRLYNVGQSIWVPENVEVRLPKDKQAVNAPQSGDDIRMEASPGGVRFVGAVPPGQYEVSYTFQVPRHNTSSTSFELGMPPNVMQARVGVASGQNTELTVEGFQEARPTTSQNGQRLLMTMQSFDRSSQLPSDLRFEIRGLPTLGSGRIVAAVSASVLALIGLAFAIGRFRRGSDSENTKVLEDRARSRLLDELAELETAKVNGNIGPKTYEETRTTLIEALVRLEPLTD